MISGKLFITRTWAELSAQVFTTSTLTLDACNSIFFTKVDNNYCYYRGLSMRSLTRSKKPSVWGEFEVLTVL
ncbi:hypothetical protein NC652_017154 [Populus alba x Populus x berolinensis]|nr:hypothetical protein NC652_017154 [Populus alba x Populus x berolinensis]